MRYNKNIASFGSSALPLMLILLVLGGCTKKFAEMNTDSTKIVEVGTKEYPYMFAYALTSSTLSPDGFEIGEGTYGGVYSQLYTQAAQSFTTDRYVIVQG